MTRLPADVKAKLAEVLTDEERKLLQRLLSHRCWPFTPGKEAELEALLLTAEDVEVELLIKCQTAFGVSEEGWGAPDPVQPEAPERLQFVFEREARDLDVFIGALARNHVQAVVVEDGREVAVLVTITAGSDHEFHQELERVRSLRELARQVAAGHLPGRRVSSKLPF